MGHGADSTVMDGALVAVLNPLVRGALIYLLWCYGGFVIGPVAQAWDRLFSVPLWLCIALAGGVPLLIESLMLWFAAVTGPVVAAVAIPASVVPEGPCSGAALRRYRRSRRRSRVGAIVAPHRLERFGRTRLR